MLVKKAERVINSNGCAGNRQLHSRKRVTILVLIRKGICESLYPLLAKALRVNTFTHEHSTWRFFSTIAPMN